MTAIAHTTGPVLVYVGRTGATVAGASNKGAVGAASARFLGTAETAPQMELREHYRPVYNDISGDVPIDHAFTGEEAFLGIDLTRWDERIYASIANRALPGGPVAGRGVTAITDHGALQLHESLGLTVWYRFSSAGKEPYAAQGDPLGYRFPGAVLIGPDRFTSLGSRAKKIHLTFHCLPVTNTQRGLRLCYDHNVAGLPAFN